MEKRIIKEVHFFSCRHHPLLAHTGKTSNVQRERKVTEVAIIAVFRGMEVKANGTPTKNLALLSSSLLVVFSMITNED
jgi:hypothetical protein